MGYADLYAAWRQDPEAFWMGELDLIEWDRRPTKAIWDQHAPFYRWYADGRLNICHNAVDRHVAAGHGDRAALVHDSPVTGTRASITFAELRDRTARLAGALRDRGIGVGDRVIIYMPMVPEAVVAMLACVRIGAIHSVVFGGFAAAELAKRIDDARPRAIIAGSCGIEPTRVVAYKPLLDAAIEMASEKPEFCVVFQRPALKADLVGGRDHDWDAFQEGAEPAECVPLDATHPCYILYTSGTTGRPKGVVRDTGGHAVALAWTMPNVYGVRPGEVFWAASDVGWVVGHSYICYAPLLAGNTSVVFEGKPVGTPDAGTFWRVIDEYDVAVFFTAPTAFRAIKRADPNGDHMGDHDLSRLRSVFFAGERADPDTVNWTAEKLDVPVIDHWWQTETGYAIVANPLGIEHLPVKVGSPTVPMPGYEVAILGEDGATLSPNELGSIAIKLPLPPGTLLTLWEADERYREAYLSGFPGFYETGDAGYRDEDGYLWIMARTDDVINVAGHRLSTGAIEEVLADHPDIGECAVVGVADRLKGEVPMGLVCLNAGASRDPGEVANDCVAMVRDRIGPVAAFKLVAVVDRLPKTRSGKILRRSIAAIADGAERPVPATIDDPAILEEIRVAVAELGYPLGGET